MKKILLIIPAAVLLTYCSSSKTAKTDTSAHTNTAATRLNIPDHTDTSMANTTDTVVLTGTQYIPLEGKSEFGTRADLEGAWVLTTMNGTAIPGRSNLNIDLTKKMAPGTEVRHDSVTTTQTVNGVTHTTTTVLVDKMGTPGNKITPPQGSNYHIPEQPSISFFGSNETFSGFTGCNKFSGRYSVHDTNSINLQSAAASTKMVCLGDYDETTYLNTLRRVTSFRARNGQLELLEGSNVLLVFAKKE